MASKTIIAVNVGGCIIPLGLAIYEMIHLLEASGAAGAWALGFTVPLNIAVCAGVIGPIVGADLKHLREFAAITTGVASIGGAGTFDGIVLSGIVAAYLA